MLKQQDNLQGNPYNDSEISWTNNLNTPLNDVNPLKNNPWTSGVGDQSIWANDFINGTKNWPFGKNAFNENETNFVENEEASVEPIDEKTMIQQLINTSSNWGKSPIDQTTMWDMNGKSFDSIDRNSSKSNVWESEPPNGTAIWDKHYATIGLDSRYRENSVETLAPKSNWNDDCDQQMSQISKELSSPWANNNGNNNSKSLHKPNTSASSVSVVKQQQQQQQSSSLNIKTQQGFISPTPSISTAISNNKGSGKQTLTNPNRPLSFNQICNTSKRQSFSDMTTNLPNNNTNHNPSQSIISPPITNVNNQQQQQILQPHYQNSTNHNGASLTSGDSPIHTQQLPIPLNTLMTQPPPLQPSYGYNRRNFNQPNNGIPTMKNINNENCNIGGSPRADLVKQFISLGYMREDVQYALFNNNMDVERTIAELNDRYPHLTHITLEHFSGQFNLNFLQHQQQQQQMNFFDWKLQRQMRKSNTEKDLLFQERKLQNQKLLPHNNNMTNNGIDPLVSSFAKLNTNGLHNNNNGPLASSNSSLLIPDWNSTNNTATTTTTSTNSNYLQMKGNSMQNSSTYQNKNIFNNNQNGFNTIDLNHARPKSNTQYDRIISDIAEIESNYEILQERLSQYISQKKCQNGNNSPTNSNSIIRELQANIVQLESQYVARQYQLSLMTNSNRGGLYLGDDSKMDSPIKFDTQQQQKLISNNNSKYLQNAPSNNNNNIINSSNGNPYNGHNWPMNNFTNDNRFNNSYQDNQFSFNNKPIRNIKINN